jgi:hypothetical protein
LSGKRAKPKGPKGAPSPAPQVRAGSLPQTAVTGVLERPATTPIASPVLPGGSRGGARNAAREERRRRERRRRLLAAACAAALLVVLVAVYLVQRGGGGADETAAPIGRTQRVVLLEIGERTAPTGAALLVADPGTVEGAVVLVPNRLMLDVAGYGSMTLGQVATLPDAATGAKALGDALGVTVDGAWRLGPAGLAALVDAGGGIDVDVDTDVTGPGAARGSRVILIPAGQQHLDGASAVVYAAYLGSGEPEQARLARLDTVLSAAIKALPAETSQVTLQLGALGGSSNSTLPEQLPAFLSALRTAEDSTAVVHRTLPVSTIDAGGSVPAVGLDATGASAMVEDLFTGSVAASRAGGDVRVLVQNGVGTPGLGSKARDRLVDQGFTYVAGGNAASFDHQESLVLIMDATEAQRTEGEAIAKALGLPAGAVRVTSQGQSIADVVVVLGRDFKPGK